MGNNLTIAEKTLPSKFKPNSIILITGASSGIGEELAIQYSKRNVKLFLCARNVAKLAEVKTRCITNGSQCEIMQCDVTQEDQCKAVVKKCVDIYGGIDILVLNAGINGHIYFEDCKDLSLYETLMKTNYYGYLFFAKAAFPYLKQSKGHFLVLSSASGVVGIPMRTAYCASKFAVTGFFEALRLELDEQGYKIDITLICPPSINTPMREKDLAGGAQEAAQSHGHGKEEKRMSTEEAVKLILIAADRRINRVYFPNSFWFGMYIRPFFTKFVDDKIKAKAKL